MDGKFTHNRNGFKICQGFQNGTCVNSSGGLRRERNRELTHQCEKCLDPRHGAYHPTACQATPREPAPGRLKGGTGNGKGGRGKGRGDSRPR